MELKRRLAKIIKIGVRSLLILLLIIGGLTILLRNELVQTKIAKETASYLSKELDAEVRIGAVSIDFARNISLSNVLIKDQYGDSMIFASNFNTQLLHWDLEKRVLRFNKSRLHHGFLNLGMRKDSTNLNLDFLIAWINRPKEKKEKKTKAWNVVFNQAHLSEVSFTYFNNNKPSTPSGIFDPQHISFTNISGQANELWLIKDSLHFVTKNLKMKEKSGLEVNQFNAVCNIHNKGMDFTKMTCKTECSLIKDELHFSYPGYKYMGDFVSNTQWKGHLNQSRLCLKELVIFDPFFKHNQETAVIDANIMGTFDNLWARNLDARISESSVLKGDFLFKGLPNWRNSTQQFRIKELRTTGSDISAVLNGMALPKTLFDFGEITYAGTLNGKFLDFSTQGILTTAQGQVNVEEISLNIENGLETGTLNGVVSTQGFNVEPLAPKSGIGNIALSGTLNAKNITDNIDLNFSGNISSLAYKNAIYEDIEIEGDINKSFFDGKINSQDPNLGLSFDGVLAFGEANPNWKFDTKLEGIDLAKLGFAFLGEKLWGNAIIDMDGNNIHNLRGDLLLENVKIVRKGKTYDYKSISLSKEPEGDGSRTELYGDLADAEIIGNVDISQLGKIIQHNLHQIFPERFNEAPTNSNANFSFNVNIKKPEYFESFIDPKLRTKGIEAKGVFVEKDGVLALETVPFELYYDNFKVSNFSLDLHKRNATSLEYGLNGYDITKDGTSLLQSAEINGIAENGFTTITSRLIDKSGENQLDLTATAHILKDSIPVEVSQTQLNINNTLWNLSDKAQLMLANDFIYCKDLFLEGEDNYFQVSGKFGNKISDTAIVDFGNLGVELFRPFFAGNTALDSTTFKLSGRLTVNSTFGNPDVRGETYIRNLSYKNTNYGNVDLSFEETLDKKDIGLILVGTKGVFDGLYLSGTIDPSDAKGDMFKLGLTIPKTTPTNVLQPLFNGIITLESGTMGGWVKLRGNADKPKITGIVKLDSTTFLVDYLQTRFSTNGDFFANQRGLFSKEKMLIRDEENKGTALAELALTHSNFKDLYLNLDISNAQNLKCLNTKEKDNDLFFGTGYADGSCKITGPFNAIDMDIRLKTRKGTSVYLPYTETEVNKIAGFVKFTEKKGQASTATKKDNSSLNRINIEIESTPETDVYFVIDKQLGDVIKGSGSGMLRMLYDENQNFYLNGTYTIEEGQYAFSLPGINLVTRKIDLDKGGQITWTGDPYDAVLNMTGSFTKKLSPTVLMPPGSGNYPPITVISKLSLTGDLFKPNIAFDLESPDLNSSDGGSGLLSSTFARIRADPDERMRQAVWLLVFGNFVPPSNLSASPAVGSINGLGVAGNSLGALVSNQANNIAAQFGLPTQFQLNLDNVGSASTTASTTSIYVNSETKLTDKVKLNLNYDNTVSASANAGINFNLEYTPENSLWRMRIFSRNQNSLSSLNSVNLQTASGYTLGTGFIFQKEFDRFKRRRREKKKKKKKK